MAYFEGIASYPDGDDLPIHVDNKTNVTLNADNEILIRHGCSVPVVVKVTDVDALTRALELVQLVQAEREAMDDRPMTQEMRSAIFAALRDNYGRLTDDERLRKVSVFAGRTITSMSRSGDMTRADASRVLDVLSEL